MAFLFGLFALSFLLPVAAPYVAWQLTAGSKVATVVVAMFCIAGAAGIQYQMVSTGGHPQAYATISVLVDFTIMMVVPPFVGLAIEEESERRKKEEES